MSDTALGFAALGTAVVVIALWFRAIQTVSIPENRIAFIVGWAAAVALGLAALGGDPGWLGGVPAVLAILPCAFFLFSVTIGGQKVGDGAIAVGDAMPAFTAPDENGESFDSADLAGHPVLIKFFRAHW